MDCGIKREIVLKYILNFFYIIVFDYDKYYFELLKNALKYGMTSERFWNNDTREYYCYQEMYYERIHEQSHIQGLYSYTALSTIVNNLFAKNKNEGIEYPKQDFYTQDKEKRLKNDFNSVKTSVKITKDNLHNVYMNKLANCY